MKTTINRLILTVIAVAFVVMAKAVEPGTVRWPDYTLPAYVRMVDDEDVELLKDMPDSLFNSIAGSVVFKVNRTELNLNSPMLKQLTGEVFPYANDNKLMLVGIVLKGAASPEGSYDNNVRLSKGRAAALRHYIEEHMDSVSDLSFYSNTVAEDYARLLWILERDNDPAAVTVRGIIEQYGIENHAAIKAAMQRADGGRMWTRLLRDVFPELRSARVVLLLKRVYPKPKPVETCDLPQLPMNNALWYLAPVPTPEVNHERVYERQHMLSVSSNLLYDAFYMPNYGMAPSPNIGLEFYPKKGKFTYRAAILFPYYHRWKVHKFFQIRDYHLEVRRYFNPGILHRGNYLALYANATIYGIGLSKTKGWEGEGMGAALKYGYVLPLGNGRWRLDFHVAAGFWLTRYDPYVYGNPKTGTEDGDYYYNWIGKKSDFKKRNHQLTWFGPTEIGITLTYDLLYYKIKKKGVSTRRWEKLTF